MPTLQLIAYKQANLNTKPLTHSTPANTVLPINEQALNLYKTCERTLQYVAAAHGIKPYGWDITGRKRSTRGWSQCLVYIEKQCDKLAEQEVQELESMYDEIAKIIVRDAERKLIGVCTQCLATGRRTPIYAVQGAKRVQCDACGTIASTADIRIAYLKAAGVWHITRTNRGAAEFITQQTGIQVTAKDIDNWKQRGKLPKARHVEAAYWEYNIMELLHCAEQKNKTRKPQNSADLTN